MRRPSRNFLLLSAALLVANGVLAVSKAHAGTQQPFTRCRIITGDDGVRHAYCEDWIFTTCGNCVAN